MTTLKKAFADEDAISYLVVGTEGNVVYIINPRDVGQLIVLKVFKVHND